MTPTLCTGSSTANDCHSFRYQPARFTSSATIVIRAPHEIEARRRDFAENPDREPGARKRLPPHELVVEPELLADRRTSSLNNSRSGSTSLNRMCSGSPPTLWWLLMT